MLTLILMHTPRPFQRTAAVMSVAGMEFVGMLLSPPDGFQWLIPVYYLKLLAGFTAKDGEDREPTMTTPRLETTTLGRSALRPLHYANVPEGPTV